VKYRHAIFLILFVIVIDQALKFYIKTNFLYGEEVNIAGHWFKLHFIENEGMAFGMKLGGAVIGKLILTLFRLVAVVFGFYLLKRVVNKGYRKGVIICGSLILAGALGNLIDSMFYGLIFTDSSFHRGHLTAWGHGYAGFLQGRVVDMLYFPIVDVLLPNWLPLVGGKRFEFFEPVFNVADSAISIGVLTLVFFQKRMIHQPATDEVTVTQ
jgi:signal peptidase II